MPRPHFLPPYSVVLGVQLRDDHRPPRSTAAGFRNAGSSTSGTTASFTRAEAWLPLPDKGQIFRHPALRVGTSVQPCPGLVGTVWTDSIGRVHDLNEVEVTTLEAAAARLKHTKRWLQGKISAGRIYPIIAEVRPRRVWVPSVAVDDYLFRHIVGGTVNVPPQK